jgi:flagellar biosynthesis/type III secretory pathway chaperone
MTSLLKPEIENALEDLLKRETIELVQFISLLEEELDALAAGNTDTVQHCVSRKQNLLGRIFASRDAVNEAARSASRNPLLKSAESWMARTSSMRIRQAFATLTDHAEQARQLNQLAGRLIQVKLRGVAERLDVLQPTGRMSAMYFPEGFTAAPMSPKGIIGRA